MANQTTTPTSRVCGSGCNEPATVFVRLVWDELTSFDDWHGYMCPEHAAQATAESKKSQREYWRSVR